MSHEITMTAGRAEMAFVGKTPWHGLGQRVTEGASIEIWTEQAGMSWDAIQVPVQYMTADGMRQSTDKTVLYRSDTGDQLGIVGDGYKSVQPREVLEFFRDLTEAGDWHIHTAGTLLGGRKLWAMARNHTEGEVVPGDRVRGNLLLATSLDGTMRTTACMTAVRVVCANTLRIALNGASDAVKVSHKSIFDADAAKVQLGVARESFDSFMAKARAMAEQPIHIEEARDVLRKLFGQPIRVLDERATYTKGAADGSEFVQLLARHVGADKTVREQRSVGRVLDLFNGAGRGANHDGSIGTRWGLFNAITEHVDHQLGRTPDSRLNSAWFGRGHELKTQAFSALA